MLSRFRLIPERYGRADGQTDRPTDRFAISISRVSMLTRDKKQPSPATASLGHTLHDCTTTPQLAPVIFNQLLKTFKFYRAMLCARCPSVRMSVCRYSVETARHITKLFFTVG